MRTLPALAIAASLATLLGGAGHAAPKPQISDPVGDAIGLQAWSDIASVLFEPVKTGRTTTGLRVSMTLAAAPSEEPGVLYRVFGSQSECGSFQMSWSGGATLGQDQVYMTCGPTADTTGTGTYTIINVKPKVSGKTMTWTFKLKQLPKEMRAGSMYELSAFVTLADPLTGILNVTDFVPPAALDTATTDASFTY